MELVQTLPQPALLERDLELGALSALIDVSAAGRLVAVEGPPGIGKSRLLAETMARAEDAGMEVLSARGSELEREFSYGVVRQLFEPLLTRMPDAERIELVSGAAGIVAPLFDPRRPLVEPRSDASFAILHGLFWLTANVANRRPLLLAIDDLHWCDAPSLRWLAYLLPRIAALPIAVVVGVRPAEAAVDRLLLAQVTGDTQAAVLRPSTLTEGASAELLRAVLGEDVEREFAAACHHESGGNPLLLRELARELAAEGVPPTAASVPRLRELGVHAVARCVSLRLGRLGEDARLLAGAVATLGDDADLHHAAAVAGIDVARASDAAHELALADVLRARMPLAFVHPVIRAAVHDDAAPAERARAHEVAALVLAEAGAEPERIAAHLLLILPAGTTWSVDVLREAARRALSRGDPGGAVAYLSRALVEPPDEQARADVLVDLGSAETLISGAPAAAHLREARDLIREPRRKAETSAQLGRSLFFSAQASAAVQVYEDAIHDLGTAHPDLRRQLEAGIVNAAIMEPSLQSLLRGRLAHVRTSRQDDLGAKMLLGLAAYHEARAGGACEGAVGLARRALAGDVLLDHENGSGPFVLAALVLAIADRDEALTVLDASVRRAHGEGSIFAFAGAKVFRGRTLFYRGALADAEADLREALEPIESWGFRWGNLWATAYLADALMEQGRLDEAADVLHRAEEIELPDNAHAHWFRDSRARLRLLRGDARAAVDAAIEVGTAFETVGGRNPALVAWRSQVALGLLAIGEAADARKLAAEELELARRWGGARVLGNALRVAGLAEGGADGLALLHDAVEVLEPSAARLEHAKALTDLGAALRRANRRADAREPLRRGLELATVCGAAPIAERAEVELLATGARPRRVALSGVASLTPSERRVADLAADGRTNREIAQMLFVTPKTVEVHLSSVYRKLRIRARAELARALAA